MFRFFSQVARAVAKIFAPMESDLVAVGFQPITDDIFKQDGAACYASDLEKMDRRR
jgi:hypothetical protein